MTNTKDTNSVLLLLTTVGIVSFVTIFIVLSLRGLLSETHTQQKCEILCDSMQYRYVKNHTTLEGHSCECATNIVIFQVK